MSDEKPAAVGLSLLSDRISLHSSVDAGSSERLHAVLELKSLIKHPEAEKPPLWVMLCLDLSGSMSGQPLEQVVLSVEKLVALLGPNDRVGVIGFSDRATEVSPLAVLTPENRNALKARLHRLVAEGSTNIEDGLRRAAACLPARTESERHVILLLSDGAPNKGAVSPEDLTKVVKEVRRDASVATLGYGQNHQEDILNSIAMAGAGSYQYVADPNTCSYEFAKALGAQGAVIADEVRVSLKLAEGVEVVRFLNAPEVRIGGDGVTVTVPDLIEDSTQLIAAELSVSPSAAAMSERVLLHAVLRYRAVGQRVLARGADGALKVQQESMPGIEQKATLKLAIASAGEAGKPDSRGCIDVALLKFEEVRREARVQADRGQYDGAAALLRKMIAEIEAVPGFVVNDGTKLAEAREQLLDEAMVLERRPSVENYTHFRKSQVASKMAALDSTQAVDKKILRETAGNPPKAVLVRVEGVNKVPERVVLPLELMIGRSTHCDLQVDSNQISRQHARIVANNSRFVIQDLGASNGTFVNGRHIVTHVLQPGDEIAVGEVIFRYTEET
jgi:Ca-activated chloride channel family protein